MMYIKINVTDKVFRPGIRKLSDRQKALYLDDFTKFIAKEMQKELVRAIDNQRFKYKWKPLNIAYLNYKKKHNLSLKTWEATGLLKDAIKVYKYGKVYHVGIDKRRKYKGTSVRVYDVAVALEFGTRYIPARPLFRPIVTYMSKNISAYWNKFLKERGEEL